MFGREAIDYVVKQATDSAPKGDWITVNPHLVVEMGKRIAELESALREIADVAEAGFADAKSSCRTEVKAIAYAARQVLR